MCFNINWIGGSYMQICCLDYIGIATCHLRFLLQSGKFVSPEPR